MNRLLIGSADKSALLLQMMAAEQDGLLLIDTTGTLAEEAADRSPVQQTCYLDPSDLGHPFGFNVLDSVPEDDRHKVVKDICAFFDVVFPEGPSTLARAKSNYLLLNCLRVLMDAPEPNFLAIPRLLSDTAYRTKCLGHCADPVVLMFWTEEFETWDEDDTLPLRSKLGELLSSPMVRNIIGQPHSTFSLEPGRIVIANLDRRKLGDATTFLLGSLLLSKSRAPTYVADLGFFSASDSLVGLLQQDRFTVACRSLDELPVKLRAAVLGIEDKTVFQTTREDAERLAFYVGVSNPGILTDLLPQEARTRTETIEPTAPPTLTRLRASQSRSRACFTRPRKEVEKTVARYFSA